MQVVDVVTASPALPRSGFSSNQAVLMLVPGITAAGIVPASDPPVLQVDGSRLFDATLTGETVLGNAVVTSSEYSTATPTQIRMTLPDGLTAFPVSGLVSGSLTAFPVVASGAALTFTIGLDGPRTVKFARKPTTAADAAGLLEAALEVASGGGPGFQGARVATTTDDRLVIVPGGLRAAVSVQPDAVSNPLLLTPPAAQSPQLFLSCELFPFPVLTSGNPAVQLTIGGDTRTIALPRGRPRSRRPRRFWRRPSAAPRSIPGSPPLGSRSSATSCSSSPGRPAGSSSTR